jgi:hypothetical protein
VQVQVQVQVPVPVLFCDSNFTDEGMRAMRDRGLLTITPNGLTAEKVSNTPIRVEKLACCVVSKYRHAGAPCTCMPARPCMPELL